MPAPNLPPVPHGQRLIVFGPSHDELADLTDRLLAVYLADYKGSGALASPRWRINVRPSAALGAVDFANSFLPQIFDYSPHQVRQSPSLEATFAELAQTWREEHKFMSSITDMVLLSSYQRIIGLGPDVVPLLLGELDRRPDHWFWALQAITGEDPVPFRSRGNLGEMSAAWITWGRQRGYQW